MRSSAFLVLFCLAWCCSQGSQAQNGLECSLPLPALSSNKPNIFNDQQEQWLGEAQAAQLEPDYELLPEKDSVELTRIGQKLLAQLPPTVIYDAATANKLTSVNLDHRPLVARFIPEKNALLVMTANQTIYSIELPTVERSHAGMAQAQ